MTRFKEEEVIEAIKMMASLKASGKDGYPAMFYKNFWHIVEKGVTKFFLEVLNNGKDMAEFKKKTNFVLIPKVEPPKNMGQFRPLSLCNVIYKIISKMVVNILRKVLNLCIDEAQGAFVLEQQIMNNILVAYEILNSYKRKKKRGGIGAFSLKLDMSKTYDKVEWELLENMMSFLGFCKGWISLVTRCIKNDSILFCEASVEGVTTMKTVVNEYESISGQLVNFDKSLIFLVAT
ncbi:reverse transcriptase [Gossypium australe]|uniref:Reverse transcriptase n=1 Tax=Gossypium australe TaxID=47621 RepID=A0A5B6VE05_9ROSI|nr:reverse transcriptase [Gossypium australe]